MLATLFVTVGLVSSALAAPSVEVEGKGQIWVVLVAGSNSYYNYRHQADVCHAYQIFHRHGIPDSNIIVMMYDDIADNAENPKKGKIFNKPNGPNVYGPKQVPKDYTGDDVTPQNFINVLTGKKKAMMGKSSGKVLKSGPNDHVFINFVDHGSTGLIGFPNDVMYADDLIKALKTMHQKKMFKKLVFYMEACESGSMFDKILPPSIGIYAATAANAQESSYACYWDETIDAYLGDEFSVAWMEDLDSEEHHKNMTTETLLKQYKNVVKRVTSSHPSMFGEKTIDKDKVTVYFGNSKKTTHSSESFTSLERFKDAVSSRDVALSTIERTLAKTNDEDLKFQLKQKRDALIAGRQSVDDLFTRALGRVNGVDQRDVVDSHQPLSLQMMPCYKAVVNYFTNNCVNINKNTYAMAHLYKFANLCVKNISSDEVIKVLSEECTEEHRNLVNVS